MEYNADQHRAQGRAPGRVRHEDARAVRLLGDRVRLSRGCPRTRRTPSSQRIAARSSEPLLAYATDEDNAFSIDPEANQGDLGNDPLDFARRRIALVQEMWDRWQSTKLKPDENYAVYRRVVERGLIAMTGTSTNVAKYIGGVTTLRDHAGSPRAPLTPVDPAKQREALKIIANGLFSADSFRFKPEFMRRVQVDWLDRNDTYDLGLSTPDVDYSLNDPGAQCPAQGAEPAHERLGRAAHPRQRAKSR